MLTSRILGSTSGKHRQGIAPITQGPAAVKADEQSGPAGKHGGSTWPGVKLEELTGHITSPHKEPPGALMSENKNGPGRLFALAAETLDSQDLRRDGARRKGVEEEEEEEGERAEISSSEVETRGGGRL